MSKLPETTDRPPGRKHTERTVRPWPFSVESNFMPATSITFTSLSWPAAAIFVPSGEYARPLASTPATAPISLPSAVESRRTVSPIAAATVLPSGENATALTMVPGWILSPAFFNWAL